VQISFCCSSKCVSLNLINQITTFNDDVDRFITEKNNRHNLPHYQNEIIQNFIFILKQYPQLQLRSLLFYHFSQKKHFFLRPTNQ
jgi:hypothetical protein